MKPPESSPIIETTSKADTENGLEKPDKSEPQIKANYTYTNPQTHKVERQETITIDIEKKTQEFLDFYKKTGIDLPPDFAETIQGIWERNNAEIQQAIEQNGFDDVLIIPANIPLPELSEKMKMEKGYFDWIVTNSNVQTLENIPFTSPNIDKPRIILVHKIQNFKGRPELAKTLNIKGQDVNLDQALTMEDFVVFQRKYFEETGKHLEEHGWTWLATKSDTRLVNARWNPGRDGLDVCAGDLDFQDRYLGVRPSRSFF